MAMKTAVMKKGATKHCFWGLYKSNSRYPESIPEGTHFTRFAKVGKVKNGMEKWEKNKQNELAEKAKKWVNACGRKGFTIGKINKDAYICSLPFVSRNGPTEEDPDPINVSFLECKLVRKKDKKEKEKTLRMRPLVGYEES